MRIMAVSRVVVEIPSATCSKAIGALIEQFGQPPASWDTLYPEDAQHRLWQTWIAYQRPLVLELKVRYPAQILESANGQGCLFRVNIDASFSEADKIEALTLSDRILLMNAGRIVQVPAPKPCTPLL